MANKVVIARARFVSNNTVEVNKKGYYNNTFFDIKIKQEEEKLFVKLRNDTNNLSRIDYESFDQFTEHWIITFKYITK